MITSGHEFFGGQVFSKDYGHLCVLLLAARQGEKKRWVLYPLPADIQPNHNAGGMVQHDMNGEFHWTDKELREMLLDWNYLGNHHELYEPVVPILEPREA